MIKSMKMKTVNYLGMETWIELTPGQVKEFTEQFTVKECLKRFKSACKSYSNNYWVTGYVNNHKLCWFQCNQF